MAKYKEELKQIPPSSLGGVRSTDYVDSSGKRVGGATKTGQGVWGSGGGDTGTPAPLLQTQTAIQEKPKEVLIKGSSETDIAYQTRQAQLEKAQIAVRQEQERKQSLNDVYVKRYGYGQTTEGYQRGIRVEPTGQYYEAVYMPVENKDPDIFGAETVTPANTSVLSRAKTLFETSYQGAEARGRETTYRYLSEKNIQAFSFIAGKTAPFSNFGFESQIKSGITYGLLKDIREEPIKQGAIYGAGYLTGYGLKASGLAVEKYYQSEKILQDYETLVTVSGLTLTSKYGYDVGKKIYSSKDSFEQGQVLGTEGKNILLFGGGTVKGIKGFDSSVSYLRTFRKIEVAKETIIAPEYFKGQKYPTIKKGETAGELKKEFYNKISEIGETEKGYAGFNASPRPFAKVTEAGKGGSEIYGLYTAPRLSATFLKLQGETDLISFSTKGFLRTARPTATRIYFEDVKLIGVSSKQISLQKLTPDLLKQFGGGKFNKKVLEFGEPKLQKGKSYVPFIKTEKESVLPFGTKIEKVSSEYYFKLEGNRVPIEKYKVISDDKVNATRFKGKKITTAEDIYSKSYKNKSYSSSYITPVSSSVILFSSRNYKSSSSSKSILKYSSSGKYSSITSYKGLYYFSGRPSYSSKIISKSKFEVYGSSGTDTRRYTPKTPKYYFNNIKSKSSKINYKSQTPKSKDVLAYAPSFTGRFLNIKTPASSKQFTMVRSGFEPRGYLVYNKRKRK